MIFWIYNLLGVSGMQEVSIMIITDKQYGDIYNFWGKKSTPLPATPMQLELF